MTISPHDHLGSTNALANTGGSVTASNSYDSFGNASNSAFPTRYQFTGREHDDLTGLQYSRARFYDPNVGRFISEDPIGFSGGDVDLYAYVKNKVLRRKDPTGLDDADLEFRQTDYYKHLESQSNDYWNQVEKQQYEAGFLPENFQCGPSPFTTIGSLTQGDAQHHLCDQCNNK